MKLTQRHCHIKQRLDRFERSALKIILSKYIPFIVVTVTCDETKFALVT